MHDDIILLGHGSGGKLSHQLLDELIIPVLSGIAQKNQNDSAILEHNGGRLAFTTDSYVVDPLFFPGGNIGDLAINGTINDLAMCGATPLAISVGLIIEEGLTKKDLRLVLESMRQAAEDAKVRIVTGDTKVVPRGKADKLFINTSGIGIYNHTSEIIGSSAKVGDKVLINGTIGDHGVAILSQREGLALETTIASDSASLNSLVEKMIAAFGDEIHVMRDPTRGGVATTLNEIAQQSQVDILLQEPALPLREPVRGVCAILGLDPLFVANEGKMLAIVSADTAEEVLKLMQSHPQGQEAAIIGEITAESKGKVMVETAIGGRRAVDMLSGEQLPRIC
jgi:hydrogenase expression/formation protein HypE